LNGSYAYSVEFALDSGLGATLPLRFQSITIGERSPVISLAGLWNCPVVIEGAAQVTSADALYGAAQTSFYQIGPGAISFVAVTSTPDHGLSANATKGSTGTLTVRCQ
jgi:hypothetical protein